MSTSHCHVASCSAAGRPVEVAYHKFTVQLFNNLKPGWVRDKVWPLRRSSTHLWNKSADDAGMLTGIVKLASKRVLAASLGFSGGIMLYVSFIEIFQKAKTGFSDAGYEEKHAYMLSTASVFAGMLLMRLLIALTHTLDPDHERELKISRVGCALLASW
eukprot:s1566_g15.t1